jgi:hypothetical protein
MLLAATPMHFFNNAILTRLLYNTRICCILFSFFSEDLLDFFFS